MGTQDVLDKVVQSDIEKLRMSLNELNREDPTLFLASAGKFLRPIGVSYRFAPEIARVLKQFPTIPAAPAALPW